MTFGPACERCGACSYDGSQENPRCPWCKKFKRRGSREGLVKALGEAKHAMLAALGFIGGMSILSKEQLVKLLAETVKEVDEA